MTVTVTRPAGGITLNAGIREYLLDQEDNVMEFADREQAVEYLHSYGLDDLTGIEFPEAKKGHNAPAV